jgi:hypothetical protein
VLGFLKEDVLAAARPEGQEGGLGTDVTVRKAVDQAEPKIVARFQDQPIIEADVRDTLGTTYLYLGEPPLAIRQYDRALKLRRARLGPDHPDTLTSRHNLAEAEPLLREALAIRAKAAPDDWARSEAMSLLGGSLIGQGRYAEAEPLVVEAYEGMKAREALIAVPERFRLREAAERVIRMYEDWGKPD